MAFRARASIVLSTAGLAVAMISSAAAGRPADVNRRGPPAGVGPMLVLQNLTDTPIDVYIDGAFVGTAEPYLKASLRAKRGGEVTLTGRYRCDRWGPKTLDLEPGRTTRLVFTEMGRTPCGR